MFISSTYHVHFPLMLISLNSSQSIMILSAPPPFQSFVFNVIYLLDTGLNTGLDTVLNTGLDTGLNIGLNTGLDTGLDTGLNTGLNTRLNTLLADLLLQLKAINKINKILI
jgi:hypothetical protein